MITVRDAQRAAMERLHTDDDRIALIVDHLRHRYPGRFDPALDVSTEERVRTGLTRARRWGLTAFTDVAAWVGIMFDVSARFDEVPALRGVLRDETLGPPSARFARLLAGGYTDQWEAAARLADDWDAELAAWRPDLVEGPDDDDGTPYGQTPGGPT